MSDFDERKILRRLNEIAQIKPAADATQRAMDKVRQQMADDTGLDEESDLGLEHKLGHKFFTIKRAIMTVAAVIVVALVITVGLMLKSSDKEPDREAAKTVLSDKTGIRTDEGTVESARSPVEVEAFLEMIEELFDAGDVSGAVTLITQASDEQRDAAMGLLARLMQERAARIAAAAGELTDEMIMGEENLGAKQDNSLTSDEATALEDDTAVAEDGTGVFSGIVIDEDGEPVAGATVFLKSFNLQTKGNQVAGITDKKGLFAIDIPKTKRGKHLALFSPIAMWAYVDGVADTIAWTVLQSDRDKQEDSDFQWGGEIPDSLVSIKISDQYEGRGKWCSGASGIVLQMEKAGNIFGQVTNSLGQPVSGSKVEVRFNLVDEKGVNRVLWTSLWPTTAYANADGYYYIGNLPRLWDKTQWYIEASSKDHNEKTVSPISDGPLDEMQIDIELLLSGLTIRGRLVDNYGAPIANRGIIVWAGEGNKGKIAKTDEEGSFEIPDCPIAEKLTVLAELSRNDVPLHKKEEYENFVYYPDVTAEIFIEEDKFEYEVELVAMLPEITIDVEVVDPDNNPVPYFPVTVTGAGVTFTGVGITDQWRIDKNFIQRTDINGQCTFTEVPDADYLAVLLDHNFKVPTDSELEPNEKELIEKLTAYYTETDTMEKRIRIPILVVAGQKNYKVQARIPLRLNQDSPLGTNQNP